MKKSSFYLTKEQSDVKFYENIYNAIVKRYNYNYSNYTSYFKMFYSDINIDNKQQMIEDLKKAIVSIKPGIKLDVLEYKYRYGYSGDDIADKFGITRSRVFEIINECLSKLLVTIRNNNTYGDDAIKKEDLDVRTVNALVRGGYKTNKDLYNIDYDTFVHIRNAGIKSWILLCKYMDKYNIPYIPYTPEEKGVSDELRKDLKKVLDKYYLKYGAPNANNATKINNYVNKIISLVKEDIN